MRRNGKFAVYTSATTTYIDRAGVLLESIRRFHPEADVFIVFPDEAPEGAYIQDKLASFDGVIKLDDLDLDANPAWIFSHDVVELCTAVKPFAMRKLISKGYSKVIYLDPDTALFSSLEWVLYQLDVASILLTPHQLSPEVTKQAIVDNEVCSLRYGVYNLGFAAIRNDIDGRSFAKWWGDRCYDYCLDEPAMGHFTDQKMCDLVPALLGNVKVLRHAGLNVASWNLSQREISSNEFGDIVVSGRDPLVFFHFTKINQIGEVMLKRYCNGSTMPLELMIWYRDRLRRHHVGGIPDRYWHYGLFSDGSTITGKHRRRFRNDPSAVQKCGNPFALTLQEFVLQFGE